MSDNDPIDVQLGATVKARREALRITQAELAEQIGVTFQQVQKYERGVNRISASRLVRIAQVLDTTAAELLGEGEQLSEVAGAHALLQAWSRIEQREQREAVLSLVKSLKAH